MAQVQERGKTARVLQPTLNLFERRMEQRRLNLVQHNANLIVARDISHLEQGLAVRTAFTFTQPPLMGQKRRALHEKHRERRHAHIFHGEMAIGRPPVWEAGAGAAHRFNQRIKPFHPIVESASHLQLNPQTVP